MTPGVLATGCVALIISYVVSRSVGLPHRTASVISLIMLVFVLGAGMNAVTPSGGD